jgi:plastocyanin
MERPLPRLPLRASRLRRHRSRGKLLQPPSPGEALCTPRLIPATKALLVRSFLRLLLIEDPHGFSASADPTPAPQPVEHKIIVGANNDLVYEPNNIQAKVGDRVIFEFQSKNHTVTQSSFGNPCQGLVKDDGSSGFKSGL